MCLPAAVHTSLHRVQRALHGTYKDLSCDFIKFCEAAINEYIPVQARLDARKPEQSMK